jgi:Zn-dependent peptidase ImmA (M78 family)
MNEERSIARFNRKFGILTEMLRSIKRIKIMVDHEKYNREWAEGEQKEETKGERLSTRLNEVTQYA